MAESTTALPGKRRIGLAKRSVALETLTRLVRYIFTRGIALFLAAVIGVYLTILIANMGGYVDQIKIGEIREQVGASVLANPALQGRPASEIKKYVEEQVQLEIKRLGLDKPFILRSFGYLTTALSLSLGRSEHLTSDSGSREVRLILLERLPATLLLWGLSDLFLFFASVLFALYLSRRYGSFFDRAVIALAPTSAAPPWFYGIILILIFASVLRILPYGGIVDAPPPKTTLGYTLSVFKHLVLPAFAIILASIFITIYNWRTFFLIFSSEDYVEMAKAKGLSSGAIERRYILRPTLPTIITSFALMLIAMWMGGIITETVFVWPGLGRLLYEAIGSFDTPVIVASVVLYAYLLAITVLLLDIIYAVIDPRVRVGGEGKLGL
jgi:peptide/nickel transport system permease protein